MKILRERCCPCRVLCISGANGVFFAFALLGLLITPEAGQLRRNQADSRGETIFNYDYAIHGQDWSSGKCASRSRQSPIDLPLTAPLIGSFSFKYLPITDPVEVMNTGKTISIDMNGLGFGGITYENAYYDLMNINVHSYSEHTWNTIRKPLEVHLVHKRSDGDALLVVSVSFEGSIPLPPMILAQLNASSRRSLRKGAGQALPKLPIPSSTFYVQPPEIEANFNPTLQIFLAMEPPPPNMKVRVPATRLHSYDLNALMSDSQFYDYSGSLTAPPCSETVTWLVRATSLRASDRQIAYLRGVISKMTANTGNYRSVMPLNGRIVNMRRAIFRDLPLTVAPPVEIGGHQQSYRENLAMKWSQQAMRIANVATDYVKDLDSRLKLAAKAHANALAPQLEPLIVHGQVVLPITANQSSKVNATTPAPVRNYMMSASDMQKTAADLSSILADEAHQAIDDATVEIQQKARAAAMAAAKEAAKIVATGQGDRNILANFISTPPPLMPPALETLTE